MVVVINLGLYQYRSKLNLIIKKDNLNGCPDNYFIDNAFLNLFPAIRNSGTPTNVITNNSPKATSPIDKISGSP